jgi:hypothetical protein
MLESELHSIRTEKAKLLATRRRGVLVNTKGAGGLGVVAQAGVLLAGETGRSVTVFGAPGRLEAWAMHFPTGAVRLVSAVAHARRPELLSLDDVLLVDGEGLSTSRDSASWRHLAPVLRNVENCLLYLLSSSWPGCLPLVELVTPFDQVVLMEHQQATPILNS